MEFDKALDEYTATLRAGGKMHLEILIKEIESEGYTTFSELNGALHTHLELINDKVMTSEQYEAEANADHITSEQFPNV